MFTSLGYHTFVISKNLTQESADILLNEFKKYRDKTGEIYIEGFRKYDKDSDGRHCGIRYIGQNKGIWWKMRFSNRGFNTDDDFKPCSIKAVINPKILSDQKSYIIAANGNDFENVRISYDHEAAKISPILMGFSNYSLNRIDYCINFDVSELNCECPLELEKDLPGRIMQLIKWSDIPDRFKQMYNGENQFYLKSESVVINCYWKYAELKEDFPDCRDLKDSYNIIRFEVQLRYPAVTAKANAVKKVRQHQQSHLMDELKKSGALDWKEDAEEMNPGQLALSEEYKRASRVTVLEDMLSDEKCNEIIDNNFCRIIKRGDYYTLGTAKRIIEARVNRWEKIVRLTGALEMVRDYKGITRAKKALTGRGLEDFRRSLRELAQLKINPVTIPDEWGIEHIPNLLDNYYLMRAEEREKENEEKQNEKMLWEYIKDCNKKEKTWWK